jgi:glycosyltransferase involved in cell wall biosynthesis
MMRTLRTSGSIGIVDPCCAGGYATSSLGRGGLGGTEATVLRVARALSRDLGIEHFQKNRDSAEHCEAGLMRPYPDVFEARGISTFLVINSWKVACRLRKTYPDVRIVLWLHVHPGRHNRKMAGELRAAGVEIVCVSRSHAEWLRGFLGPDAALRIGHVYNPIDDDLVPDATSRDPDRLLFASSPHKGLAEVFAWFRECRKAIPGLTLAVADPGYLAWDTGPVPDGVIFLGALPHHAVIAEMRRSLCLFQPQTTFAETFGLVLAEANAVGTPVLVQRDLGANAEVAGDPEQLIGREGVGLATERLRRWRTDPPVVRCDPRFRLGAVARRWSTLLGVDAGSVVRSGAA